MLIMEQRLKESNAQLKQYNEMVRRKEMEYEALKNEHEEYKEITKKRIAELNIHLEVNLNIHIG